MNFKKQSIIFITATNTDVGKTFITLKLIKYFSNLNKKVGVFKPIETGVQTIPHDGDLLLKEVKKYNQDFNFSINDIVPYWFGLAAAPYVAKQKTKIDQRVLYSSFKKIANKCDVLLIEGAGGLMVPISKNFFMVDLIKLFGAFAILVAPSKLGSINDTLLSKNILEQNNIEHEIFINTTKNKDDFYNITYPYYEDNLDVIIADDIF